MLRRPWADRRESGSSTLEYAAAIAVAAILIVAVLGAAPQSSIGPMLTNAICRVAVALGVIPCVGPSGDDGGGGDLDPDDVDIPEGVDRDSDLVQTLLSTERGRQTLQWLADNDIPIVIDPDEEGAFWNGSEIVLGEGYVTAAVVVHEANHARYTAEGRHANARELDRDAYIAAAIAEEVDGTVQQILAAKEFRVAGGEVGPQPAEDAFDAAYAQAIQNGQTLGEAERAAAAAVRRAFDNGDILTSNSRQTYAEYYGEFWDSVN